MTNENTSLEKYTSHTLFKMFTKGLCVVGELVTEQTATYWPPSSFVFSSTSLSFCWAAESGVLMAHSPLLGAGSLYSILSPTNWLQTNWTSCGTGLYNCLTSARFLWASHLHPIEPVHGQGYILMSSTGCTCSWVEGQYVTTFKWPWIKYPCSPLSSVVNVLNCDIAEREFDRQSCYYIQFTTNTLWGKKEYFIPLRNRLNSATIQGWLWH